MAGEARTVRVSGLPVDIIENRLIDKIYIHFLRRKNGGGEINSVTFSKTTSGTAFITFEDREVASRLVQQAKQVFRVGDKKYDITVSPHHESVDVDEVLLHMSVTVDHSKLPEGKLTLLALQTNFPGVHISFDSSRDVCSLDGCYSQVQTLSNLLLGSCDSQIPGDTLPSWTEGGEKVDAPLDTPAKSSPLGTDDQLGLTKEALQRPEELDVEVHRASWKLGPDQLSRSSHQESHELLTDGRWNLETESGACFEDFSFVVDSDIFRYLHKYCSKDYQNILRRHRVEVLDEMCQDITTLYLKPKKGLSERGMGPVKHARQELAQLYQDKGSQLRKEQIPTSGIPQKGLKQALETLRQRLPQLMIEEEEGNVNLVGSGSDVSEAKQFITDVKGTVLGTEARSDNLNLLIHSQSNFPISKQTPTEVPPQLDIFQPLGNKFQDDLFIPRKGYQKAHEDDNHRSNERRLNYGELTDSNLFTQQPLMRVMNDDIFSVRREDTPAERHVLADQKRMEPRDWSNTEDFPSVFPKCSLTLPTLDLDTRSVDNPAISSEEAQFKGPPDANSDGTEKQLQSARGRKTKRVESGRDLKMAANFSREMCTSKSADAQNADEPKTMPKLEEGAFVFEKPLDHRQPHSLPFIKPSMNSSLSPVSGGGSGLSKVDVLLPKGHLKQPGPFPSSGPEKRVMMPAYSTESPPFSLGHMDLCGDAGFSLSPAMASGSDLKRSNSFSGRIRKGYDEQTMVDMSARQKRNGQRSQERKIFTVHVPVSIKQWLYLKSVYSAEIDNLTSDLQLKEDISKDEFALCLRGAELEKVKECQLGLTGLIATVEPDFCARTLPLSLFGVSDSKDKTLLGICARMHQSYERVKILVLSKEVMILGPRLICEEVEAAMKSAFFTGVNSAETQSEKTQKHSPISISTDVTLNSNSETPTDNSTLTVTDNEQVLTKKNLHKMSDQRNACISKQISEDQTRDTKLTNVDNQDQGDRERNWNKVDIKQNAEERTEVEPPLKLQIGKGGTSAKEIMKTDNLVITVNRNEGDEKISEEYRTIPDLPKSTAMKAYALNRGAFTEGWDPGNSVSQAENDPAPPGGPDLSLRPRTTSHVGGNESFPCRCECGAQGRTSTCTMCGASLISEWQGEAHASSDRSLSDAHEKPIKCQSDANQTSVRCLSDAKQSTWGIRGTISIRESTITIPGFIRDTTLRIVYDIPDGIQGEDNPCPGAPFKGNRFEAFLPLNEATKKLLPLLKKAFHKGLTFTIKSESPGGQGQDGAREGRVVWGSIPHKTNIEGGTSKNGYPDSTYIRRLTQTLKTAGLEE